MTAGIVDFMYLGRMIKKTPPLNPTYMMPFFISMVELNIGRASVRLPEIFAGLWRDGNILRL